MVLLARPANATSDGKKLVEAQCLGCHTITPPEINSTADRLKIRAPDLSYSGNKFNRQWLEKWLQKPTTLRPAGTLFLHHVVDDQGHDRLAQQDIKGCAARLTPEQALSVTDYLMTLTVPSFSTGFSPAATRYKRRKAMQLFRKQQACVACHRINWGKRIIGGISGPDLTDAGTRLNPEWVYAFIKSPQQWSPFNPMPKVALSHKKISLLTQLIGTMDTPSQQASATPAGYPGNQPVVARKKAAQNKGRAEQNYQFYCAQCHGLSGNGKGINGIAGALSVSPRNHTRAKQMGELSNDELQTGITGGGDAVNKSGLMPAWGNTLSPVEIEELVNYLRTLCNCRHTN
jgi:mono/diheme cytochrome c family protein